jgi:hypothetical protein
LEKLKFAGLDTSTHDWIWFRTASADIYATKDKKRAMQFFPETGSSIEYTLSKDDVGQYIGVVYRPKGQGVVTEGELASNTIGPVLPGPPRILNFTVTGNLTIGHTARAETHYIGGTEGKSEFWWMRISSDGKRTQVTEPKATPAPGTKGYLDPAVDARLYTITEADVGCTLKAKCRPIRSGDNAPGEIFTSKSSETVAK